MERHHPQTLSSLFRHFLLLTAWAILTTATVSFGQKDSTNPVGKVIPDTLLFRLEKVQAVIVQINAANKRGYNAEQAREEINSIRNSVEQIRTSLKVSNPLPESKDLLNYRIMLNDILKTATGWRKILAKNNSDLQSMSEQVIQFSADSLLKVVPKDTTQRTLYASQIKDLRERLQLAGETTVTNLDTVSRLLADASSVYFTAIDLRNSVNEYLKDSDQNLLGREADYIWASPATDKSQKMTKMIRASYAGQDKILRYFFTTTWDNRVLLLIVVIAFFIWININYRLIRKRNLAAKIGPLDFRLISPVPVLSTLVVFFNLTPLFEPHAPSIYIEVNQFMLLITLSILFARTLPKAKMKWWIILLTFYVVTVFLNIIVNESFLLRTGLMLLSLASVYLGFHLYKRAEQTDLQDHYIKPVLIAHMVLTSLSVLLNVFGRLSLAKSFNITGISGIIQLVSLAVMIQVISEAMELHIKVSSFSGGLFSKINVNNSRSAAKRGLGYLCLGLWLLVFLINLNILDPIFGFADQILTRERTFGSITFTFGNILFFSLIIYLANQLQRNIGVFFGETGVDFTGDNVQKGSMLALVRLVIIVIGVLFAVTASGVPLTRITVLLGALGVGIGLGLQNIINNFVSGIILIFEKPFNIGDFIELADKKGKVLEIGIRSSKMLTSQGSRLIIPNGDLLSGRLVNYTQHDSHLKSEITFKVNAETDPGLIKKLVDETVGQGEGVVKGAPRQVLFNAISGDSIEFKVLVWLRDVYVEPDFRSFFFEQILQKFKANGIKIM